MQLSDAQDAEIIQPQIADSQQAETEDPQEKNWRGLREALRESKESARRSEQTIEELKQALQQAIQPRAVEENDDPWEGLQEDDVLEVAKAKKVVSREAERVAKKAVAEALKKQQSSPEALEASARSKYKNFDDVMSQENIETIIKTNPLVHQTVMRSANPIEAAYHFIANSAAFERKAQSKVNTMVDKAKIQENLQKPKNPNQIAANQDATSTVGFARLSKQQQKELWVEHNKKLGRRC